MVSNKWTLVQHSGYVTGHKPGFRQAVEVQSLRTEADEQRVAKAGGMLFDSYGEASKAEEEQNYPPEVTGLYPRCKGTFSVWVVDGRPIYVPAKDDTRERIEREQNGGAGHAWRSS